MTKLLQLVIQFVSFLTKYLNCREQDREESIKKENFENELIEEESSEEESSEEESFEEESFEQLAGHLDDVLDENEQLKNDVDELTRLNDVYRTLNSDFARELNQTKMKLKTRVPRKYNNWYRPSVPILVDQHEFINVN